MKKTMALLWVLFFAPTSVQAHAGDHHGFDLMAIVSHFLTHPFHLVVPLLFIAFAVISMRMLQRDRAKQAIRSKNNFKE